MTADKSEKELLEEISGKLDRLIALQATQGQDHDTRIKILTKMGLSSREIGLLLGQRADSVRHRRTRRRKPKTSPAGISEPT